MKFRSLAAVGLLLMLAGRSHAATLTITSPVEYQVFQRGTHNSGRMLIEGRFTDSGAKDSSLQARLILHRDAGEWRTLAVTLGESFSATLDVPAGGWYRLEIRILNNGEVLASAVIEHVGVGEVFVVAGQSNSANHGEERLAAASGTVVTFDGTQWKLCKDPQPGATGEGGSFLPPFGDAIAQRFQVPVGLVSCGIGATSVREWLPKDIQFPNPPTLTGRVQKLPTGSWTSNGEAYEMLVGRMRRLGHHGFRAVLWHQGESDANQPDPARTLPGSLYRKLLQELIDRSRSSLGWEVPWFVAQVSYHVRGDEASPDIRAAQASLWTDRIALPGPDTDRLKGEFRDNAGKGVHFSGPGLRAHAAAWVDKVAPWLEQVLGLMSQPTTLANLLPGSSFEHVGREEGSGWSKRAWRGEADCHWTVESPGRSGQHSLSIRSERGADAAWTAMATVRPNAFYRLSGWIKTHDVQGAVGALLNIQNMQQVRTPAVRGTKDWTSVSTVFRAGTLTNLEINCLFGGWGSSTGQAWYDDVALELLPDPSAETPRALVSIKMDAPSVPYSPLLFGGFIEHFDAQVYGGIFDPGSPLADRRGFRRDVIAALRELRLSIVRWPGGCFASGYNWRDGIGQVRLPVPDPVWGVTDPNTFGTDEFIAWCRLVGCEPYICSNAGNGTPEDMRNWVEYCNGEQGVSSSAGTGRRRSATPRVRYWSIGNENWGGHEIGARTPRDWGPLVRRSAELMRTVDPSLILLAAATPDQNWTVPLLNSAGKHLDYVAIHEYWLPCWGENLTPDYLSCIMRSGGPENTINRVIEVLEAAGCRGRIRIAFDEWNLRGWHHPGFPRKQVGAPGDPEVSALIQAREKNSVASQYSMADALFAASFLNACLRHARDVGMANIAPIVNTRGPLFVHSRGLVKRTTFHTLALYANGLENRVAPAEVEGTLLVHGGDFLPVVDAVATVNEEGTRCTLALVNRHPSQTTACTVKFRNKTLNGRFSSTILEGDSPDAFNDVGFPNRVTPRKTQLTIQQNVVTLPPHSLSLVRIGVK